jgi:cobalt-zinc-cadmium efflux system outer membrane protein
VSIDEAVKEAVDNNLGLLAERFNVSVADARIQTARLRPNPVLSMGLDYQDVLGTGFSADNGAGPKDANARVDWVLERGWKREYRIETARYARAVAESQLLNTTRLLVMDVQSAFVDVLQAKESLALARQNRQSFERIVEINTARVQAGDLAKVELVRTRVAALQFQNAVRQAESRVRVASNKLQTLMGRPGFSPAFEAAGDLRRDLPLDTEEALERQALEMRPDVTALKRDEARSAADVRLQIAEGKSDYTVGTMYHRQYATGRGNSMGFFVSAPLPVFNRNQGEIERARREREQIRMRIRSAEAQVRSEVRNAWMQYAAAREQLEAIEKNMLQEAREVRDTMDYSYRRGEASFLELLDAQRAYNDTVQGYNEARAEYARSLYEIDSATGKAVAP